MSAFLYFGILVLLVAVGFVFFKRPMYEVIFVVFLIMTILTGNGGNIFRFMIEAANTYLLYTIAAFICFAIFFEKTGIIQDLINIIMALVGKFSGGAGYVALMASVAMGALSGTGPGNAAAIGVLTIPAMKQTGYPAELAATVEMAASSLGPVIPPSGAIMILFAALDSFSPNRYSFSQFWLLAWAVSFWFLLHRAVTLFFLIRKYKVNPIPKEKRLPISKALRDGWKTLLLPVIIFVPFFVDAIFHDSFVVQRLGEDGADAFASVLLTVIPSIAILFVVLLSWIKGKRVSSAMLANALKNGIPSIAPVIIMAYAGFCISELFDYMGVAENISAQIALKHIPLWFAAIVCPLIFTVLGMFMEVTSLIILLGPLYIALAASAGIHPMLAAMMVNPMSCAMGHMTPPFALCFYVCMGGIQRDDEAFNCLVHRAIYFDRLDSLRCCAYVWSFEIKRRAMKNILLKKCIHATELLFTYGMSFLLIASLFVALAYGMAFIAGQPLSVAIHLFISKHILPPIYISAIILAFVGIGNIYLKGEKLFCLEIQTKKK